MIVNNIYDIEYTVMLLSLFGQWFEFNMNFDVLHERYLLLKPCSMCVNMTNMFILFTFFI